MLAAMLFSGSIPISLSAYQLPSWRIGLDWRIKNLCPMVFHVFEIQYQIFTGCVIPEVQRAAARRHLSLLKKARPCSQDFMSHLR